MKPIKEKDFVSGNPDHHAWLKNADRKNDDYLMIVCDTFEYEDYPVYCKASELFNNISKYNNYNEMSKIMDIIELDKTNIKSHNTEDQEQERE